MPLSRLTTVHELAWPQGSVRVGIPAACYEWLLARKREGQGRAVQRSQKLEGREAIFLVNHGRMLKEGGIAEYESESFVRR